MTGRDAKAITTSFARSEVLAFQGYKFRRLEGGLVEAQGKPTTHKNRKTGLVYVDPHGPYLINTKARTCTCPAFANRGACCHLPYALRWLASWERGESMMVQLVEISRNPIAFKEIEGERYHVDTATRRIVVFRDWEAAGAYWEEAGLVEHTELVELRSIDLEELAAKQRYAGLVLQTPDGAQPIPLPEVDWSARKGFIKREDFD